MTRQQPLSERLLDEIRQHADVVVAHDAVHPDRSSCGGLGACAIMRAEHDAEEEVIRQLQRRARTAAPSLVVDGGSK